VLALGSELMVNGNMESGDPPSSWTALNGATLASVADERTGGAGSAALDSLYGVSSDTLRQTVSGQTIGTLYYTSWWMKNIDATQATGYWNTGGTQLSQSQVDTIWAEFSGYFNAETVDLDFYGRSTPGAHTRFDDVSLRKVTDCPATGVHITTTPGGTTENWTTVETGFAHKDIVSIKIYKTGFNITGDISGFVVARMDDGVTPGSGHGMLARWDSFNARSCYLFCISTTGTLRFYADDDGADITNYEDSDAAVVPNGQTNWFIAGFSYDASTQTVVLYFNGLPVASTTNGAFPAAIYDGPIAAEIGSLNEGSAWLWDGEQATLALFSRVLSAEEQANFARSFNLYSK